MPDLKSISLSARLHTALDLFLLPGGRPRGFTFAIHTGGLPRRFTSTRFQPLQDRERLGEPPVLFANFVSIFKDVHVSQDTVGAKAGAPCYPWTASPEVAPASYAAFPLVGKKAQYGRPPPVLRRVSSAV